MYGRGSGIGFGPPVTPLVIKQLIIANVVVYALQFLPTPFAGPINGLGPANPVAFWEHWAIWQPFTYMWMHDQGLMHIGFNMLALWMFGSSLAMAWGEKRFLQYYLVCGVGAGLVIVTLPYITYFAFDTSAWQLQTKTVGASGAVMGVLLAFSFTWPDRTIMLLFPPIPLKAIYLIPLLFLLEFMAPGAQNISHAGHLGGVLVGWLYLLQEGRTPGAPTLDTVKYKWRRYRMRQKLRAVQDDEGQQRRRERDDDDHRTYH